jgi:hypothetical protein
LNAAAFKPFSEEGKIVTESVCHDIRIAGKAKIAILLE